MALRDDWKNAHKFISVRALAVQTTIMTAWPLLPDDMKAQLPDNFVKVVSYFCAFMILYGVLVKQKGLSDASDA